MIQSNSILKEEILNKQKKESKQMEEMIKYVINYFEKNIDNSATVRNFMKGRKLLSIYNNTNTNFKNMKENI